MRRMLFPLTLVAALFAAAPAYASAMSDQIDLLGPGVFDQAAAFFGDFSGIVLPLLGLLVFMLVAGSFIKWLRGSKD